VSAGEPILATLFIISAVSEGTQLAAKGIAHLVNGAKEKKQAEQIEAQKKSLCTLLIAHCNSSLKTQEKLAELVAAQGDKVTSAHLAKVRTGVALLKHQIEATMPEMCRAIVPEEVKQLESFIKRVEDKVGKNKDDVKAVAEYAMQLEAEEAKGTGNAAVAAAGALFGAVGADNVVDAIAGADAVVGTAFSFRRLAVQINGYVNEAHRMQQQHEESVADLSFFTCRALLAYAEGAGTFPVPKDVVAAMTAKSRDSLKEVQVHWHQTFITLLESFESATCPILTNVRVEDFIKRYKPLVQEIGVDLFKLLVEFDGAFQPAARAPAALKDLKVVKVESGKGITVDPGYALTQMFDEDGKFRVIPSDDLDKMGAGIIIKTAKFEDHPAPGPITSFSVIKEKVELCPVSGFGKVLGFVGLGFFADRELQVTDETASQRKALVERGFNLEQEAITFNKVSETNGECELVRLVWKRLNAGLPVTKVFVIENPPSSLSGLTGPQKRNVEMLPAGTLAVTLPTFNLRILTSFFKSFRSEFYLGFHKHSFLYWDAVNKRVVAAGETKPRSPEVIRAHVAALARRPSLGLSPEQQREANRKAREAAGLAPKTDPAPPKSGHYFF